MTQANIEEMKAVDRCRLSNEGPSLGLIYSQESYDLQFRPNFTVS